MTDKDARKTSPELRAYRNAFRQLRSDDHRALVSAYRFGELAKVLHKHGWTWEELGLEVDRKEDTIKLYVKLFNTYATEKDLLDTAGQMKTSSVSRLAGHSPLVPVVILYHCGNCGAQGSDIVKTKKTKAEVEADKAAAAAVGAPTVRFEAPHFATGTDS
jgi:hypothetical protein